MIEECIQLQIDQAIDALAEGEVVVFPTETVYGIGVDSTNYEAVDRLFEVKQRPKDNPVTLHVSDVDMVKAVAYVTDDAQTLMADFWPGALAIILEVKENTVSPNVNAGKKTVGFRLPDNDIAKQLIAGLGKPVAGTSANVSGQLSSTSFKQVTEYFQDNVAAFIDGGPSQIGIESTVIDLTTDVPASAAATARADRDARCASAARTIPTREVTTTRPTAPRKPVSSAADSPCPARTPAELSIP